MQQLILRTNTLLFLVIIIYSCGRNEIEEQISSANYLFSVTDDQCIQSIENRHLAFTSLIKYKNGLYLAFREGNNHAPTSMSEYGKICILKKFENGWETVSYLSDSDKDLRDPFFCRKIISYFYIVVTIK